MSTNKGDSKKRSLLENSDLTSSSKLAKLEEVCICVDIINDNILIYERTRKMQH